ncbi:MAG: hypothetical protein WBV25_14220 [Methylocella sp.]
MSNVFLQPLADFLLQICCGVKNGTLLHRRILATTPIRTFEPNLGKIVLNKFLDISTWRFEYSTATASNRSLHRTASGKIKLLHANENERKVERSCAIRAHVVL